MIVIAAAMMLAGADPGAGLRHGFVECLKTASSQAKTQKVGVDGFVAFAHTTCANAEAPFKSSLIDADVQHGMSHKDSASDAESQLSDYYSEWLDHYKFDMKSAMESNPAPAATPAAAPAPAATPAPPPPTPASKPN